MRHETISFKNAEGLSLAAQLDLPVDNIPIAYALFAHCFTCTKNLTAISNISQALTQQGIAVLRFDFTGLGESEGAFEETTFSSNVEDVVAAAQFMAARNQAPAILIGHSLGGAAVLQAARQLDAVKAVATLGAPFDPAHVKHLFLDSLEEIASEGVARVSIGGRPFQVKKAFLDDLERQASEQQLARLKRAVLLFHSPIDQVVGIENAALLFQALRHPKSFVSLDQADHLLSQSSDSEYVGMVLAAWARKYIGVPQESRKQVALEDNQVFARLDGVPYRTEILANGFPLIGDEPVAVGGGNTGPSPYDYVVAGLGACTAMTLRMYADRKGWPLQSVTVRLDHQKIHAKDCGECEQQTGMIDVIIREVELGGPLDGVQQARLLEIANRCPVHRTLEGKVMVKTSLREFPEAPAQ